MEDEININIRGISDEKDKKRKKIEVIRKLFSNNLIIIDEAHKLRDETLPDQDSSLVVTILSDICIYSQNMKLLLLTATPMYDKPSEIITLLNFMLLNDKRPILKHSDIFKKSGNDEINELGMDKLLYSIRGYVSYMRGNNPDEFPIRLSAKVNLPASKMLSTYPTKTLTGANITSKDKIKYFDLVKAPLGKEQQNVLLNININEMGDEVRGVAYQGQLQAGNFIYQTMKDTNNVAKDCYGALGLNAVTGVKNGSYYFKDDEFAKELLGDNLKKWSTKYHILLENIKKSSGPVFIYSNFISGGILPLTFILELNGYTRYNNDTPFLNSKYKSQKKLGEYVYFTGSERKSVDKYLNKRHNMIHEPVKIFICSAVANEGLNLFGYRESHILDPWYNVSSLEQTIGRCIRRGSHLHLPEAERNVTVYLYASVFIGSKKDVESYDLRVYNIVEKKAINTGVIQKIIKENSVDCAILKKNNTRTKKDYPDKMPIITSHGNKLSIDLYDKPRTVYSFYQDEITDKCETDKYKVKKHLEYDNILDFDISLIEIELREIIDIVKIELKDNDNIMPNDLLKLINDNISIKHDISIIKKIYSYVINYFSSNSVKIINNMGDISLITVTEDHIIRLLTLDDINPKKTLTKQLNLSASNLKLPVIKQKADPDVIDVSSLIQKLSIKNKVKKTTVNYSTIIKKLFNQYEMILSYKQSVHRQISISIELVSENDKLNLLEVIINKMLFNEKKILFDNIIKKLINKELLSEFEKNIVKCMSYNIVYNFEILGDNKDDNKYYDDKYSGEIYGYIITNSFKLYLYKYIEKDDDYIEDKTKLNTIISVRKNLITNQNIADIFSFILYSKNEYAHPIFKIIDYESKGHKKSVKGITCTSKLISKIKNYINMYNISSYKNVFKTKNKNINCNNLEIIMKLSNTKKIFKAGENIIYMGPEYYYIWNTK